MNIYRFILIAFLLFPAVKIFAADIPMLINYQGSVTDATGSAINGSGYFKFAIVDAAGAIAYWVNDNSTSNGTEPIAAVVIPVTNGVFTVKLGDTNLANMAALSASVFNNANIYLKVWFSFDGLNFEQFSPDTQIVSTGFAFKAQEANAVVDNVVTSSTIQDNSISNADISDTAAISASKIDSTGLDADSLDGLHANDFAISAHSHSSIDADTVDGIHASAFALVIHGHTHSELVGVGSSDHHSKTSRFTEMQDTVSLAQIPDGIARSADVASTYVANSGATMFGPLTVNANVSVQSISYQNSQTKYLMLAGGQCAGPTDNGLPRSFSCSLSSSAVYWSVNVPNGASLLGMQVSLFTASNTTTVCRLEYGVSNAGTLIGAITDTGSIDWHWSNESTFRHVANTSANAYAVSCSNDSLSASFIGAIRIRYTMSVP